MLGLLVSLLLSAPRRPAPAASPPAVVEIGAEGYGLTVLLGSEITRFAVEYLGVLERALPGQDLHLVRVTDPRFKESGVIAGMSGSPIYFEDRLLGALSYAWAFSKEPIAAVTPIEAMRAALGPGPGAGRAPLGDPRAAPAGLAPVATPLWIAGVSEAALAPFREALSTWGFEAVPSGAASDAPGDLSLEPGAAVGVRLVRGDLDMTVIGTVTERQGDRVFAFGHPMMGLGEAGMPLSTAVIRSVIPSVSRSIKLGAPVRDVGRLSADALPGIAGDLGRPPRMIPMTMRIEGPRGVRTMRMEVADHRLLTPLLMEIAWSSAAEAGLWDMGEATYEMTVRANIEAGGRRRTVTYRDVGYGALSPRQASPLRPLEALVENPHLRVRILDADVSVRARLERRTAEVVEAGVAEGSVRPGETLVVWARLEPYDSPKRGGEIIEIPLSVPADVAPGTYEVWVGAGRGRGVPGRAFPESLDGWVRLVEEVEPRDRLVAEILLPAVAAAAEDDLLPGLPPSIAGVHGAEGAFRFAPLRVRADVATPWILSGGASAVVVVEEPAS